MRGQMYVIKLSKIYFVLYILNERTNVCKSNYQKYIIQQHSKKIKAQHLIFCQQFPNRTTAIE